MLKMSQDREIAAITTSYCVHLFFCSNVDKYFLHINEQMFSIKNIDIVYTF